MVSEQDPLLPKRVPSLPSGLKLNPLATAFEFQPKGSLSSSPPSTPASSSRFLGAALHSPLAPTLPSASTDDLHRAHTLSPHTQRSDSASTASAHSEASYCSILPTRTAFFRNHQEVQFPAVFVLTTGLAVGLGVATREVRWWDLGLGAVAWLASESIKSWVFDVFTRERRDDEGRIIKGTGLGLPTMIMAIVQELLRLGAISLAVSLLPDAATPFAPTRRPPSSPSTPRRPLPPLDTLFFSALWLGVGWAVIEVLFNSRDFWRRMQLYDEVLDDGDVEWDEERGSDFLDPYEATGRVYGSTALTSQGVDTTDKSARVVKVLDPETDPTPEETEDAIEARIRAYERDELEGQLGVPLWEIPAAVVIVWRIDSILLSLVLTLFLSLPFRTTSPSLVPFPLWPTFAATALAHVLLSLLWVLDIPRVGIPSVSFATLIILLVLLFAVLGAWGALE